MAKRRTHLEVLTIQPSESDPDGDGFILCGYEPESDVRLTHHAKYVTCKNCLRAIEKNLHQEPHHD